MSVDVSVIIPIYNLSKYLPACLGSLLHQNSSRLNFEFVLVNDGSTDNSAEICEAFLMQDSRFIYLFQGNAGPASARRLGISHCHGEYVFFLDGDDYLAENCFQILEKYLLSSSPPDILVLSYIKKDALTGKETDGKWIDSAVSLNSGRVLELAHGKNAILFGMAGGKAVRRDIVNIEGPIDEVRAYEDSMMLFETYTRSRKIAYDPSPAYFYLHRPGSTTYGASGAFRFYQCLANLRMSAKFLKSGFKKYYALHLWVSFVGYSHCNEWPDELMRQLGWRRTEARGELRRTIFLSSIAALPKLKRAILCFFKFTGLNPYRVAVRLFGK